MNQYMPPTAEEIQNALGLNAGAVRRSWTKRLAWAVLLAALAGLLLWYFLARSASTNAVSYETASAATSDLVVTVSATGKIEPITKVDVGSELSGIISEVLVSENDNVKAGDVLARLDVTRLTAQLQGAVAKVAMAEAGVKQAEASAEESRLALERQLSLGSRGVVAKEQVEIATATAARAEATVESAKGQLAAARADLAVTSTDLNNAEITTPIDGIVMKRAAEPGQTVAASLQAPVLFEIARDLRRIQLEAQVDEADIGAVKEGQQAQFTVDAYRDRKFPAVIERLSFAPEEVDGVVTYKAVLSAANDDLSLRPGMTATARITVEDYKQKLVVPNEALRFAPPREEASSGFSITQLILPRFPRNNRAKKEVSADGLRSLYVLRDGAPAEVRVETGASDGKQTIILPGDLKAGDQVIIAQRAQTQAQTQ
jgi:HlyD family secretion protein